MDQTVMYQTRVLQMTPCKKLMLSIFYPSIHFPYPQLFFLLWAHTLHQLLYHIKHSRNRSDVLLLFMGMIPFRLMAFIFSVMDKLLDTGKISSRSSSPELPRSSMVLWVPLPPSLPETCEMRDRMVP